MPDDSSQSDEGFADLFAKLPDPRRSTPGAEAAPGSRRAAREAAERATTGETEAASAPRASGPSMAAEAAPDDDDADLLVGAGAARVGSTRTTGTVARPGSRGDLDDLFSGAATTDDVGRKPMVDRKKRRLGGWIILALILVLIGGVTAGGFWVWNTYQAQIRSFMGWEEPKDFDAGTATGEALVTISSGDTGSVISQALFDAGVTKTSDAFYSMLVKTNQNPTFYPGVYQLQQHMTSEAALALLQDPTSRQENTATIPEGLSYTQALQRVADATGIPDADLMAEAANYTQFGVPAEAPSIEGFLFPATYTFDPGVTAHDAIQTMVDRMFSQLDQDGVAPADRLSVLSLAALIQRESGPNIDDMYKISRVFQNRIDQGMLLQSDATVAYGAGSTGTYFTTQEQRDDASNIYNTYVHPGLPVGPIGLPGADAIDAALHPADGTWLYFVVVDFTTGETAFADTLDEHEANVAKSQANCAANPDVCQ